MSEPIPGQQAKPTPPELRDGQVTVASAGALSQSALCHRQDPSGILEVDGVQYVYYARTPLGVTYEKKRNIPLYMSIACAASRDGGHTWQELGDVMAPNDPEAWHSRMRHGPHVVTDGGRYFMYFTFSDPADGRKKLAMASADAPAGPFNIHDDGAKLSPDSPPDSALVDDPCVIRYRRQWHMYYKGRPTGTRPVDSCICLARADTIEGPWEKDPAGALFQCHTANLWPHREGVAAISANPNYQILYAPDGVDFAPVTETSQELRDSGTFCPDAADNDGFGRGVEWGLFMAGDEKHRTNYFLRWELDMRVEGTA
jgi:hypothetical protein